MQPLPVQRPPHLQRLELIDAACARFESALKQGGRPSIQAFLDEAAAADRSDLLEELLLLEWTYREKRGERPIPKDDRQRFSALAGAVDSAWQRWLINWAEPSTNDLSANTIGSAGLPPPKSLPVPVLGGYEDLERLGEGAMGVVYRAHDVVLKRLVALKMLKTELVAATTTGRLRTEAEALARLQHPHIVQVHACVQAAGDHPVLVLEYVPGGTLDERLRGPLAVADAARLVAILARAVQAAHEAGVVHRDLKPSNVLMAAPLAGNAGTVLGGFPKVTDFGLAHLLDRDGGQALAGAVVGTPMYMAPEQAAGRTRDLGPKTDVWALGVILYRCLTGAMPFAGDNMLDTLERIKNDVPRRGEMPAELEAICLRCLEKQVDKRSTAAALAEMLERFLAGPHVPVPVRKRQRSWAIAAGVVCCITLAVLLWPRNQAPSSSSGSAEVADSNLPAAPLKASLVVKVFHHKDKVWRSLGTQGALPARKDDLVRVQVKLDRPACSYLLLLTSQGEVIPLYPWNEEMEVKVGDADSPPPVRREQAWSNPRKENWGWPMDDKPGLETLLLLVRDEPLPAGFKLRRLLGEVPAGDKAALGDKREAVLLALDRGAAQPESFLSLHRGIGRQAREADEALAQLMARLKETFMVQRAARFAHVAD
jgi:serine/threonine protein kinase